MLDNSGTELESMYLLDAESGRKLGAIEKLSEKVKHGVVYTSEFRTVIEDAKKENRHIIAIHNHPQGFPPSVDDHNKAYDNGYLFGIVCGANGQIYQYSPPNKKIPDGDIIHTEIEYLISLGSDVDRVYTNMLKLFDVEYKIVE